MVMTCIHGEESCRNIEIDGKIGDLHRLRNELGDYISQTHGASGRTYTYKINFCGPTIDTSCSNPDGEENNAYICQYRGNGDRSLGVMGRWENVKWSKVDNGVIQLQTINGDVCSGMPRIVKVTISCSDSISEITGSQDGCRYSFNMTHPSACQWKEDNPVVQETEELKSFKIAKYNGTHLQQDNSFQFYVYGKMGSNGKREKIYVRRDDSYSIGIERQEQSGQPRKENYIVKIDPQNVHNTKKATYCTYGTGFKPETYPAGLDAFFRVCPNGNYTGITRVHNSAINPSLTFTFQKLFEGCKEVPFFSYIPGDYGQTADIYTDIFTNQISMVKTENSAHIAYDYKDLDPSLANSLFFLDKQALSACEHKKPE